MAGKPRPTMAKPVGPGQKPEPRMIEAEPIPSIVQSQYSLTSRPPAPEPRPAAPEAEAAGVGQQPTVARATAALKSRPRDQSASSQRRSSHCRQSRRSRRRLSRQLLSLSRPSSLSPRRPSPPRLRPSLRR